MANEGTLDFGFTQDLKTILNNIESEINNMKETQSHYKSNHFQKSKKREN